MKEEVVYGLPIKIGANETACEMDVYCLNTAARQPSTVDTAKQAPVWAASTRKRLLTMCQLHLQRPQSCVLLLGQVHHLDIAARHLDRHIRIGLQRSSAC